MKDYNKAWDYFGFSDYTLERLSNAMVASGKVNQSIAETYKFIASLRNKSVAQMGRIEQAQAWRIKRQLNATRRKTT